jgi:hypothetical protein
LKRRAFISLFGGTLAWPLAAGVQQGQQVRRIAVLMGEVDDPDTNARLTGFRQGLERLGWSESRKFERPLPTGVRLPVSLAGIDGPFQHALSDSQRSRHLIQRH